MFIYYFLRLVCIFVHLIDFVKRSVLTLVDELPRFRNYHYYYYLFNLFFDYYHCLTGHTCRLILSW